jgi:hypothetical protein
MLLRLLSHFLRRNRRPVSGTPAYGVHSQGYALSALPVNIGARPGHLQRHSRLNAAQPLGSGGVPPGQH